MGSDRTSLISLRLPIPTRWSGGDPTASLTLRFVAKNLNYSTVPPNRLTFSLGYVQTSIVGGIAIVITTGVYGWFGDDENTRGPEADKASGFFVAVFTAGA